MSLLRFGGKDPQGNAKGINTDAEGNLVAGINSSKDLLQSTSVPASGSIETEIFQSQSDAVSISYKSTDAAGSRIIDVHWLDNAGEEISVDTEVFTFNDATAFERLKVKSPNFKFTVHNTHTSNRDVTLTVGSIFGFNPFEEVKVTSFNTDAEVGIRSSVDVFPRSQIAAESSVETGEFTVQSSQMLFTIWSHVSGGTREVDIHWLDNQGNILETDENVIIESEFKDAQIHAKSGRFKCTIRNTHTSNRTVSLTVSSFTGVLDREMFSLIQDYRNELVRPKHTIISMNEAVIGANSFGTQEDMFGGSGENPYRFTTGRHWVGDFSFIYVNLYVDGGTDNPYEFVYGFSVSDTEQSGGGKFNRFTGFNGETNELPAIDNERFIPGISSSEERSTTGWIEVMGNHLYQSRLYNNDDVERTFRVALMGIR